jgi:sodium-dependent dicarboxylate transporter 2/3/5
VHPQARRRFVILLVAAAAFTLLSATPWHPDVAVRRATAIAAATLVMWIGELTALGLVALWIPVAATLTGLLTWEQALRAWGHPIIFLFLGAFLLARALDKHGLLEDLVATRWFTRLTRGGDPRIVLLILACAGLLSTAQNNTAVTAMLLPLAVTLARRASQPAYLLLALSYGATLGGMATPVGTAPNFIGYARMKELDEGIHFLAWLRVGVPVWLGSTFLTWCLLRFCQRLTRADTPSLGLAHTLMGPGNAAQPAPPAAEPSDPADATRAPSAPERRRGQRWALLAFLATVLGWIGSAAVTSATGPDHPASRWVRAYLPEALPPIVAAWALLLIRVGSNGRTVLDRRDFQSLDWDTLFLIAGGLCLGQALEESGAARALAEAATGVQLPPFALLLLLGGVTVLLSELTSNTATAAMMVPLAAALAAGMGFAPAKAVWLVALAASLGFALPVSTPPNALVYGTRLVPLRVMAFAGVLVDVAALVWLVACIYWLA